MAETIHPRIRLFDWSPSRWSQLQAREVEGGDVVSVMLESAANASEERLSSSVSLIDTSAPWASYRGIFGFGVNYWNALFKSFILNKKLDLSECPAVEVSIKVFPMFNGVAYSSQFFHNDHITFPKAIHESPADLVQNSLYISPLPSAKPFQLPFGGSCAFALEGGAELSKMASFMEDFSTFNLEAVGCNKKFLHSYITTYGVVAFRLWNVLTNRDVEKERFASVNQNSVRGLSIFKNFYLILANIKRNLYSLLESGDGSVNCIWLVDKPEKPLIQVHRKLIKHKQFVPPLFVGFSNSIPRSNSEVCRELELFSGFPISDMVKGNRIKDSALKGYVRNVVASILKSFKRVQQLLRIFSSWLKLTDSSFRELHSQKAYMQFKYLNFRPQFLPWLKRMGFLEVIL